jgi:hypothetical protein
MAKIQRSCLPESVNLNQGLKVLTVKPEDVHYVQWGMVRNESLM